MSTPQHPMSAENVALVRRLESLFKAMSNDFLLREQFVTDPATILFEYLHGAKLPPGKAAVNNQLLYSVMSNPELLRWIRGYVLHHRAPHASHARPAEDFAKAVVQHWGHHVVLAMMRSAASGQALADINKVYQTVLASSLFGRPTFADGTEGDPTHPGQTTPGTNIDPTTPGTNIDPTTPGTNIDPTTPGTNIDPTTPGTNIDPTTPNSRGSFFGPYYFSVTLESLAQYANQLKNLGSIDTIASEA